jgi:hypothetical protein
VPGWPLPVGPGRDDRHPHLLADRPTMMSASALHQFEDFP